MSLSLKELRSDPPKVRPERSLTICLAPHLVAEVQAVSEKLDQVDSEPRGPVRMNQPRENPEAQKLRDRLAELLEEMTKYEGQLRIRAVKPDGDWRLWANANPARAEGDPARERDERVTGLVCSADALLEDLATYVVGWNDEDLEEGDYVRIFETSIGQPDKMDIARNVVAMYESRLDFPQWRSRLYTTLETSNDSNLPENSESLTGSSTDGSPKSPNGGTTKKATRSRSPRLGTP